MTGFVKASTELLPGAKVLKDLTEPLPGSDAIGQSYDVFGYYANPKSVMKELFDFAPQKEMSLEGHTWLLSTDFIYYSIRDTEMQTVSLRTKDAYTTELATSVKLSGSYGFFSASVESDFSQSFSDETDSTYTSVRANVNKWKLSLRDDIEGLRSKVKPSFKQALATMDAVQLFDTYGTHYVSEGLVGGRADYVATTKTSAFTSDIKISAVAEASYATTAGGQVSAEYKKHVETFRENSSTRLYAIGGSALPSITDTATYNAWLTSIDTRPVFCGFTYQSLRPIWELADSTQRQDILKIATEKYVPARITRPAIVDLQIIVSDNYWENPPYGYTKIGYDLNANAGGKYIFLCYKQQKISVAGSTADPEPVTDLYVAYGDDSNPYVPPGYTKINKDLNTGSGGKYIYLCYTKDPSKAESGLPIRGIRVIGGENQNIVAPYGFTKINVDLNMGAKGDWIFFCYSRHLD
ncbi:hypothetical protein O6H91_13G015200 [Diphasiastrum complanatum]|nr:hypothetical protein O6H91_13G015200 [Diphasiastrum complanatum]